MQRYSMLRKTLRDQQWQVAGFGLSLAAMAAMTVAIWPSYRNMLQNFDIPPALQAFLGTDLSIATPAGFLSAEFFSWIPILLIVYAVIAGTGAIAGEENNGTLDLVLAQPLTRQSLLLQKAAATVIGSVAIVAIGYLGFAATIPFVAISISLSDAAVACANMLPITLLFFSLSLWLGAVLPNRATASAGAVGVATAAYFLNSVATGIDALRDLRYASPFYYYGAGLPLLHGIEWSHAGVLLSISALLVVLALRTFTRRDVSTGGATELDLAGVLRRIVAREASS